MALYGHGLSHLVILKDYLINGTNIVGWETAFIGFLTLLLCFVLLSGVVISLRRQIEAVNDIVRTSLGRFAWRQLEREIGVPFSPELKLISINNPPEDVRRFIAFQSFHDLALGNWFGHSNHQSVFLATHERQREFFEVAFAQRHLGWQFPGP